ncbi:MAG: alternative ribosome rescue aminoacyl-tRNA hydrolase ArfB [Carboxylicivirga sp.]|jgi:ribosome-associated protein|nr:alternative ribosome rescue aminoacyl-tRNA hydrolase ArfB [Carboxylicivirga sp.]
MIESLTNKIFINELDISASRSSGPGGQNVNKVNTKVTVRFNIMASEILNQYEKELIIHRLKGQLTSKYELIVSNQQYRSQLQNKLAAIEQVYLILRKALQPIKKRIKTKRTKASVEKRLSNKKIQSLKKANRRLKEF